MPSRRLEWHVDEDMGWHRVVDSAHRVVALCNEADDAESIAHEHNKSVLARREYMRI
jgi:hypothetical protein